MFCFVPNIEYRGTDMLHQVTPLTFCNNCNVNKFYIKPILYYLLPYFAFFFFLYF